MTAVLIALLVSTAAPRVMSRLVFAAFVATRSTGGSDSSAGDVGHLHGLGVDPADESAVGGHPLRSVPTPS